jgi:hypothetical protein
LVLVLKEAWGELPERRRLPRSDTDAVLARLVTACIDEYYGTPQTGRAFDDGHGLHSDIPSRADSQNAEMY